MIQVGAAQLHDPVPTMMAVKLFLFVLYWTVVVGQLNSTCPFPGIPAKSTAESGNIPLEWSNRREFESNEIVTFSCVEGWQVLTDQSVALLCQENGKWNASVPRCGE